MLKLLSTCMITVVVLCACAKETYIPGTVKRPQKKRIIIPDKGKDPTTRPYEVYGKTFYPLPDSHGFTQTGRASWYGKEFHGKSTSNGEIYDMYQFTAAHKTLPMGTFVQVINLDTNKETVVRINDRGPFAKARIIDLSYAAAKKIGLVGPGTANVKISALGKKVGKMSSSKDTQSANVNEASNGRNFAVQVGAFKMKANAEDLARRLEVIFKHVEVNTLKDSQGGVHFIVWVSQTDALSEAVEIEKKLEEMGFKEAFIVSF